jgi:hypothetical protein
MTKMRTSSRTHFRLRRHSSDQPGELLSVRLRLRLGSIVSIMPPKRTPVQNTDGTAATSFAARLLIEPELPGFRSVRVAQSVHVLGGVPAGRRELARLAMPPVGALPLFYLRLMPVELLLALGKLTAQMPLHALGEAQGLKARLLLVQVDQDRFPSGALLRAELPRAWRTCGGGPAKETASGTDHRNQDRCSQQPPG